MSNDIDESRIAPTGKIWVCCACGKTASDRYGIKGQSSYGWDESCMLNSILADTDKLVYGPDKRVREIKK